MSYFHVTRAEDIPSILLDGLVPQVGPRSSAFGEERAGVFLFTSFESAEHATMNWLGEEFGDDEPLALLEVDLPQSIVSHSVVPWELIVEEAIPPAFVRVVTLDF